MLLFISANAFQALMPRDGYKVRKTKHDQVFTKLTSLMGRWAIVSQDRVKNATAERGSQDLRLYVFDQAHYKKP